MINRDKDLYEEFLWRLIEANDETKTKAEHDLIIAKFNGWKQGVMDAAGRWFNGDNYYIEKFIKGEMKERPICCGMFLDWSSITDRKKDWEKKVSKIKLCVYFQNTSRGIDCEARNCPCDMLYEPEQP